MTKTPALHKTPDKAPDIPLNQPDNSTYFKRMLTVLPAAFCVCFTVILFGPCEMTWSDLGSLTFSVGDVLLWMGIAALAVCAAVVILIPLLRGKRFDTASSVILAAAVAAYIEGTFVSSLLGILGGNAVSWEEKLPVMLLDLLMWTSVLAVVLLMQFRFKKVWKAALRFVPIVLVVMQVAGLCTIVADAYKNSEKSYYLTRDGVYDFSSEKNVLVFILDRLDYDYVKQLQVREPEFFDELDGFTCYTNAMSVFARTNPGASFVLAGDEEDAYKIPREEYYDKQWEGDNLLSKLAAEGCRVDLYGHTTGLIGSGKNVVGSVGNLSERKGQINGARLIRNLGKLTVYRYGPYILKPYFWCYTEQVNEGVYPSLEVNQSVFNSAEYELNTDTSDPCFKFYHFIGSHPPYTLNADGSVSEKSTDLMTHTKGSFQIVFDILDEMKEKGIYKNSSVIILADHGNAVDDCAELQKATTIGMFYKPCGEEGTPLKYSNAPVSQRNIPATILKEVGIETDGEALSDVPEDADVERLYYKSVVDGFHEGYVAVYSVKGDANVFRNWTKIDEIAADGYFY